MCSSDLIVPEWRPATLHLPVEGVPDAVWQAEVVNQTGSAIWSARIARTNDEVEIHLPRFTKAGRFYLRLYALSAEHDLLTEVPFAVKLQF